MPHPLPLAALLTGLLAPAAALAAQIVVAANPMAAEAGMAILTRGGSAIDAAVAVQAVLGLVEPQSSGIGGGAFLLHYDAAKRSVVVFNGREQAPQSANPTMFLDPQGAPLPVPQALKTGHAIGVPSAIAMLAQAQQRYGKLPWSALFDSAIHLARAGYPVPPRLAKLIAYDRDNLAASPSLRDLFLPGGQPLAAGQLATNPAYADTLAAIAARGPAALQTGPIAEGILAAANAPPGPAGMTAADLARPLPAPAPALCAPYRQYRVCAPRPPSAGGIFVLQTLGQLSRFDLAAHPPISVETAMLLTGAEQRAAADRDAFVADPRFSPVPIEGLIDQTYLANRASSLSSARGPAWVGAGSPPDMRHRAEPAAAQPEHGTSTLAIVDAAGNAVAMTTSVEFAFGAQRGTHGFVLNNQLTDFALVPQKNGQALANRAGPGKQPRSAMAPVIVLDAKGKLVAVAGSAGGARIPGYVVRALTGALDWQLPARAALALPHIGFANKPELERDTQAAALAPTLHARGVPAMVSDMTSGSALIVLHAGQADASADPRRDGTALIR